MSNTVKTLLTTASGIPVADNQNSLTAGPRGPVLLEDFYLIEKLAHFNRERIPERVVHAKGSGAYGIFTVTKDITHLTKAKLFASMGKSTPIFVRFSTVGGEKGSADTERDPRGFAIKFYTEEGNWDLVGNNTPVFFIRDPMKFPDFVHTQKRDPQTNLKSATMMWDFWSHSPEALHQITILFSDRGIPDGYRHMDGFSSHTFSLVNTNNERVWIKWHFKTKQGIKNLSSAEAARLAGLNPDYAQQDLFVAIQRQENPGWRVYIQVMTELQAEQCAFNPFDLTKVWPHADFPLNEVGELILNRNPENYFAEVEQAAFSPANLVPGIDFSPDKVLQARIFSYPDAQRYRIGTNYQTLPINQPKCPFHHHQRDGAMRFDGNGGTKINYEPNSFNGPVENSDYRSPMQKISGDVNRYDHRDNNDDYTQAGNLFRLMSLDERTRLIQNIVHSMKNIPEEIQLKQINHFYKADKYYGALVAEGLNIKLKESA
jgi:catalase